MGFIIFIIVIAVGALFLKAAIDNEKDRRAEEIELEKDKIMTSKTGQTVEQVSAKREKLLRKRAAHANRDETLDDIVEEMTFFTLRNECWDSAQTEREQRGGK